MLGRFYLFLGAAMSRRTAMSRRAAMRSSVAVRSSAILLSSALALGGCESFMGEPVDRDEAEPACGVAEGSPPGARLLTRSEYRRTVADLLGEPQDPTRSFPAEPEVEGFDNNATSHLANPLLIEQYAQAATVLAADARGRGFDVLVACEEAATERSCAERFVDVFGQRVFRRPLQDVERLSLLRLYDRAAPAFGHDDALAAVVESMLQSPQFLYRVEAPVTEQEWEQVPLGPYELASRLSYFLWGTMPDRELFEAAASDSLNSNAVLVEQARRMIEDPKTASRVREFHRAWLGLDRLEDIVREGAPEEAGASFEESLLRFLDEVFWSDEGSLQALFSSSSVHLDATLAPLYEMEVADETEVAEGEFTSGTLSDGRKGLLTQPGLLALLAHSEQSSPIQRGVFVRDDILCSPVPAPPPDVNNTPPDPDPGLTTRERFAVHTEDPGCRSCHRLIDPVGFGFESFDHLGRYRTEENGNAVDTTGELTDAPDPKLDGPFSDPGELSERLASSRAIVECIAGKWFTFALGHVHTHRDQCSLDMAVTRAQKNGHSIKELLVGIVTSPAFRYRPPHEGEEP